MGCAHKTNKLIQRANGLERHTSGRSWHENRFSTIVPNYIIVFEDLQLSNENTAPLRYSNVLSEYGIRKLQLLHIWILWKNSNWGSLGVGVVRPEDWLLKKVLDRADAADRLDALTGEVQTPDSFRLSRSMLS